MSPPSAREPGVAEAPSRAQDSELERATRLELLEAGAQMLHVGTWDRDLALDESFWSIEMRRICGVEERAGSFSREAALGLVHPEDRELVGATITDLSARPRAEPVHLRHRVIRPSGELRWVESRVRAVTDAQGRATRLIGATIDRTELELAAQRVRDSERLAQIAVEQAADAILISDGAGYYLEVNPAACALLGYPRDELLGRHWSEVVLPSADHSPAEVMDRLRQGEALRSVRRYRRKDGTTVVGSVTVQRLSDGRVEAIVRDVTEQTKAETALRESEAHYRNLFENAQVAIFRSRVDGGQPLDANRRFCELVEATREQVLSKTSLNWWKHPAEREEFVRLLEAHGTVVEFESTLVTARGTLRRVLSSATLYADRGVVEGSIIDVTERTKEESAVRASLREKEVLLQEVHHRVKNNLQLVSSLLNLQASREADPRLVELLRASQNRVAAMALVHQNLYQAGDLSRVAFAKHCRAIVESICRSHGVAVHAVALEAPDEVLLPLDVAVPLGLVLNELVTNALRHAYAGERMGPIRVSLHAIADGFCRLEVRDEGRGLPEEGAPSSSTLGLSLVARLVGQFSGRLSRWSEAGKGTSWTVEAPLPFQSVALGPAAPRRP